MAKKQSFEPLPELGQTAPTAAHAPRRAAMPFDHGHIPASQMPQSAPLSRVDAGSTALQLLWFDDAVRGRLRRDATWRAIVDALANDEDLDLGEALKRSPADDPDTACSAFEILARAPAVPVASLRTVLGEAVRANGKLAPPLVVVAGSLSVLPDPSKRLQIAVAMVEPMAAANLELQATLAAMKPYVAQPRAIVGGANQLFQQLLAAVRSGLPNIPLGHLESAVGRMLLEERAFERRDVLGEEHQRALLDDAVPLYLPAAAARQLPLAAELRVRVIAEVYPRVDEAEPHGIALRARAVARELDKNAF